MSKTNIQELHNIASTLLTASKPKIDIEVDGRSHQLTGSDARSYGCGIMTTLKILGHFD